MAKSRNNRSGERRVTAGRKGPDADYGDRKSASAGDSVSDGAGTRSRAGLPPETVAMKSDKAELPAEVMALAYDMPPLPDTTTKLIDAHEPWDYVRDRKLGLDKRPSGSK